jgi:hypothetical protein
LKFSLLRNRALIAAVAVAAIALMFVFARSLEQQPNQQAFQPGIDNSVAFQTISVSAASVWNVEMEITYSDHQRQAYLDKVSRRIVSMGSADAWRPTQHLPLMLTVSRLGHDSLQPVLEETINSEPFYGSGDHAGFLSIAQLQLEPGKYRVSIRTLKGDAGLSGFGARLLVSRNWD